MTPPTWCGRGKPAEPGARLPADLPADRPPGWTVGVFEADTNPEARVGRDLLDLDGKVRRISVNSHADGTTEHGAITDPRQVDGMVRMLLAGPVDQRIEPAAEQPRWLLAFHLLDGTATVRTYYAADRRVQRGILVPQRFGDLVKATGS